MALAGVAAVGLTADSAAVEDAEDVEGVGAEGAEGVASESAVALVARVAANGSRVMGGVGSEAAAKADAGASPSASMADRKTLVAL